MFFSLISSLLQAEIRTIQKLEEMTQLLPKQLQHDTWVIFDIDYTLTEPDHPALHRAIVYTPPPLAQEQLERFPAHRHLIPPLQSTQYSSRLVESHAASIVQELAHRGATVLGFTAIETSVVPHAGYIPEWRGQDLLRHGIRFTEERLPPEVLHVELTEFSSHRGTYPLMHQGVLYSNGIPPTKGTVLSALLKRVSTPPKVIVMIDDTRSNLESIEEALTPHQIPFLGLHYVNPYLHTAPEITDEDHLKVWATLHDIAHTASIPTGCIPTTQTAAIRWAIESLPKDSLVIFDIGNVLLAYQDTILHRAHEPKQRAFFQELVPEMTTQQQRHLVQQLDQQAVMRLVDPELPELVRLAQAHHATIALSRYLCGEICPGGKTFEEDHLEKLKAVGIEFKDNFQLSSSWTSLPSTTYLRGLVQTEHPFKGPVLEEFLNDLKWTPKAILFIDDRREQCDSIAASAKAMGIPCLCIQYKKAILSPPPLDEEIAKLQALVLVQEGRWLSDSAARFELLQRAPR